MLVIVTIVVLAALLASATSSLVQAHRPRHPLPAPRRARGFGHPSSHSPPAPRQLDVRQATDTAILSNPLSICSSFSTAASAASSAGTLPSPPSIAAPSVTPDPIPTAADVPPGVPLTQPTEPTQVRIGNVLLTVPVGLVAGGNVADGGGGGARLGRLGKRVGGGGGSMIG